MYQEAVTTLREAGERARRVRVRGGGTKLGWAAPAPPPDAELTTAGLDRMLEHNTGDLTAVVQAGVPMERLREELAGAGQMLAVDPPVAGGATVGGVLATADSGPLRHRHGGPRDLVLGVTVALSDGTLARAGGKVIKNVAGYDLAKLFTGSFGTLGAILEVAVRLHPMPRGTVTAVGESDDPAAIAAAASGAAHSAIEAQCLDVRWADGTGAVLVRLAGAEAATQAGQALHVLERHGLEARSQEDDEPLWEAQRTGQRSAAGTVVRVSGVQSQIESQIRTAQRFGGSLVGRAAFGLSWIVLPEATAETVADLRRELAPSACVVLDAPAELRERVDVWGATDAAALELMRRVKMRFDPAGACNPGVFVGGI